MHAGSREHPRNTPVESTQTVQRTLREHGGVYLRSQNAFVSIMSLNIPCKGQMLLYAQSRVGGPSLMPNGTLWGRPKNISKPYATRPMPFCHLPVLLRTHPRGTRYPPLGGRVKLKCYCTPAVGVGRPQCRASTLISRCPFLISTGRAEMKVPSLWLSQSFLVIITMSRFSNQKFIYFWQR